MTENMEITGILEEAGRCNVSVARGGCFSFPLEGHAHVPIRTRVGDRLTLEMSTQGTRVSVLRDGVPTVQESFWTWEVEWKMPATA